MRVPIESIQYILDVFIGGGCWEDEDLDHIDVIDKWIAEETKKVDAAFQRRINKEKPKRDFSGFGGEIDKDLIRTIVSSRAAYKIDPPPAQLISDPKMIIDWDVEPHPWPDNPMTQKRAYPTDYPVSEEEE